MKTTASVLFTPKVNQATQPNNRGLKRWFPKNLSLAVVFLSLSTLTKGATFNEWLFDSPPVGSSYTAVNQVSGGASINEIVVGVAYQNLQVDGGPFYAEVGGQALSLSSTVNEQAYGTGTDWTSQTAFTIELWVNPDAGSATEDPFDDNGQDLRLDPTTGGYVLDGYVYGSLGYTGVTGDIIIPADTWTEIALTYNGSTADTYVNGTLDGTTSVSESLANTGNNLNVGSFALNVNPFAGEIDEIRESNVALLPGDGSGNGDLAYNDSLDSVPEPGTLGLLGCSTSIAFGLALWNRRRFHI